jgi:hypothetical protein
MKVKIYSVNSILRELQYCILYKRPFSHIRFGDGGLKYIQSVLKNDSELLDIIVEKEGLPQEKTMEILKLWVYYANKANFIDSPEVYFNGTFWPRVRTLRKGIRKKTEILLKLWKDVYDSIGIVNYRYCNPESHYLFIIEIDRKKLNLFQVMRNRKICIICARPEVKQRLEEWGFDVDVWTIVGHYENHYENSFRSTINFIKHNANSYDLWLVAAGELGRIYSGYIKECGGRTLDMGFVIDFWCGDPLKRRLCPFLCRKGIGIDRLKLHLTADGRKFMNQKKVLYK